MSEPLLRALARMRSHILDPDDLVRAVASGRQKGTTPRWRRVELRYVDLKAGRHLQVTAYDETQAHTANHAVGDAARDAVDDLLDEPFGNWHVETTTADHQLRVTKKLEAVVHTADREPTQVDADREHDRDKARLLAEDDPCLRGARALRRGGPDEAQPAGEVPPGRGVPAAARRRRSPTRSTRATCAGRRPRTRCGSSTSAAATPT